MKFCIIAENYLDEAVGGAEIQCNYIALELLKRGFKVYYIYKSNLKAKSYNNNGIIYKPIYIPKIIQRIISHFMLIQLTVEYKLLHKTMNKIKAEYWYYRSVNTFLVSLVRIKNKIGGQLIYALSMDMQARKSGWISRYGRLYHNIFINSLHSVDYFIFQKQSQKTEFFNEYSYDGHVIYNGHPKAFNSRAKVLNLDVCRFKIIWIGNLKKMKQPEKFIEIVRKLHHLPIEFHMIGERSFYFNDLISQTEKEINNFHYHGQMNNSEVLKMISTSSLAVSTSSSEGFPNVLIESWKFGVPVISLIDPDGLINKYRVGYMCKDVAEMADNIEYLLNNSKIYEEMSTNCLKLFDKYFSIEKNVSSMLQYINEVNDNKQYLTVN